MKIDGKLAKLLFFECYIGDKEPIEGYRLIYESDWEDVDRAKYFSCTKVFEKDGKFYALSDTRSGSYFTDWNYDSEFEWKDGVVNVDFPEVKKVEKIIYEWVDV